AGGLGRLAPVPADPAGAAKEHQHDHDGADRQRARRSARRRRRRLARVEAKAIDANRSGNVLDGVLAGELAGEWQLAFDLIVGRARQTDAAALGQALKARRDIDAVAVESLALDDDVAEVDADAKAPPPRSRELGVARLELALDVDRALHGVDDARELREHVVAGRIDDPSAVAGHRRGDHRAILGDRAHGRQLVVAHEAAVAFDVRA